LSCVQPTSRKRCPVWWQATCAYILVPREVQASQAAKHVVGRNLNALEQTAADVMTVMAVMTVMTPWQS
jgi:hypothetical protein